MHKFELIDEFVGGNGSQNETVGVETNCLHQNLRAFRFIEKHQSAAGRQTVLNFAQEVRRRKALGIQVEHKKIRLKAQQGESRFVISRCPYHLKVRVTGKDICDFLSKERIFIHHQNSDLSIFHSIYLIRRNRRETAKRSRRRKYLKIEVFNGMAQQFCALYKVFELHGFVRVV